MFGLVGILIAGIECKHCVMDLLKQLGGDLSGLDGTQLSPTKLNTLEHELERLWPGLEFEIIERFRSRKNIVIHLCALKEDKQAKTELVAKLFVTDHFENELRILKRSHERGLTVPRIISSVDERTFLNFVKALII